MAKQPRMKAAVLERGDIFFLDALPDIFRELQLRKERQPVRPLFEGKWA
jgi:hypothetical protein